MSKNMEDPKYTIAAYFSPSEIATCVRFLELVAPHGDWKELTNLTPAETWLAIRLGGPVPKAEPL
jgi:hypothetical protein